jgi:hypothetical protein
MPSDRCSRRISAQFSTSNNSFVLLARVQPDSGEGGQISQRRRQPLPELHFGGTYQCRFLSEWTKAQVQICGQCEQVAGSIGRALAGWTSDAAGWPWEVAKAKVERNDHDVIVTFVGGRATEAMQLGSILWPGPWLVPRRSPQAQGEPPPLRYVGNVPEEHRGRPAASR